MPDGRLVAYRCFGAAQGPTLIALHGTPGSRLKFSAADESAKRLGLRIVAPDRWGYGATSVHKSPSLGAFADDIGHLADHLCIDRFSVLGVSGGGPYAVAVAAGQPKRVEALALVAPVGPIAGEADCEITLFHRLCFGALARRPAAIGTVFRAFRAALAVSPQLGMRLAMIRISPADRKVLRRGHTAARLGATFVEGLQPGVAGPITDLSLFGRPWNIDFAKTAMPARSWLGTADRNVPLSAVRRLSRHLPTCELVELEGAGHLWIAENYESVLGWIARQQKGVATAPPGS